MSNSPKGHRTTTYIEQATTGKGSFNELQQFTATTLNGADVVYKMARKSLLANYPFALRLNCGLLQSDIDLDLLGGLEIQINLNSNFSSIWGGDTTDAVKFNIVRPYLIVPLLYKNADQIAQSRSQPQGVFSYMSYQSLYSVMDSTDQSVVHRLNAKNVLSVLQNYIPVSYINNRTYNGMACWDAGGLTNIEFHKDGVRYPLEYNIEVKQALADTPNQNEDLSKTDTNPQVIWNTQSAIKNTKDIKKSCVISENLLGINKQDGVWGTGVAWDLVSGSGVNINGTITYDIKTKLEDPVNNDAVNVDHTLTAPYAQYSFYLNKSNILVNKNQGIVVM